jgi:hypothetical protein
MSVTCKIHLLFRNYNLPVAVSSKANRRNRVAQILELFPTIYINIYIAVICVVLRHHYSLSCSINSPRVVEPKVHCSFPSLTGCQGIQSVRHQWIYLASLLITSSSLHLGILRSFFQFFLPTLCFHVQSDQKASVHLMISIQYNVTAWQPTARARGTLDSH